MSESDSIKNKRKTRYFDMYIVKLLKIISPFHSLTNNAKKQLNSVMCILATIIHERCIKILLTSQKKTISVREISCAVKLTFTENLQIAINSECIKSLDKYNSSKQQCEKTSKHTKLGMIFPPYVSEKFLRNFGLSKALVSNSASIYLSNTLEYVCAEIIASAIKHIPNKKSRISIREIELGIKNDFELNSLFLINNICLVGENVCSLNDTENTQNINASSKMKRVQNVNGCLFIPKTFFERLVRNCVQKYTGIVKLNKTVLLTLQYIIEDYLVRLLKDANRLSIYTGRKKLTGDDINFIFSLTEKCEANFAHNEEKILTYDSVSDIELNDFYS